MKLKLILISINIFTLFICQPLYSETGNLSGVVRDNLGNLMPWTNVWFVGTQIGIQTNERGEYLIRNIPVGFYILSSIQVGCDRFVLENVEIVSDSTTVIDIVLNIKPIEYEFRKPERHSNIKPEPVQPPQPSYQIGDTGPGGGIIFFVKDHDNDSWRYLEMARNDTDRKFAILIRYFKRPDILHQMDFGGEIYGGGKVMTEYFMKIMKRLERVRFRKHLKINKLSDWYIPNNFELLLMYRFFYETSLGDFKAEVYTSSSVFRFSNSITHINQVGPYLPVQWDFATGKPALIEKPNVRLIRMF